MDAWALWAPSRKGPSNLPGTEVLQQAGFLQRGWTPQVGSVLGTGLSAEGGGGHYYVELKGLWSLFWRLLVPGELWVLE